MIKKILVFAFLVAFSVVAQAVDLGQIEKDLNGSGVEGWIHGAVQQSGLYVFTYRNPEDFFDYIEMSLVSFDSSMIQKFSTFNRHDKVRIQGSFLSNPSPQKHILVKSIEMITPYQSTYPKDPYGYETKLPDDLFNKTHGHFLVHAVIEGGQVLVLEYKDAIIPIFVKDTSVTKTLYRGDIVDLYFKFQQTPSRPTHLIIDETASEPLRLISSIKDVNGKSDTIMGALIMFPKSPEIKFNVFAVQQKIEDGLSRQFTLVNFDSPEMFKEIRSALQKAWDRHPMGYINGRNKLVSQKITVRATGILNEIDPNQANPQVLLKDLSSIEIFEQ
jgi:hypothetical protein